MELDRFFLHPYGQLGLGLSVGYMWNSAKSFQQDTSGHATDMRATDDTGFKMLPVALMVVYRATALADRTVIPLVPYAATRLALNPHDRAPIGRPSWPSWHSRLPHAQAPIRRRCPA